MLVQRDVEFHEVLWDLSGNLLLRNVLDRIKHQFRLFLTLNWKAHGGIERVVHNHRVVIDAMKSGDPERARSVMANHVVVQRMVERLRQSPDGTIAMPNVEDIAPNPNR